MCAVKIKWLSVKYGLLYIHQIFQGSLTVTTKSKYIEGDTQNIKRKEPEHITMGNHQFTKVERDGKRNNGTTK